MTEAQVTEFAAAAAVAADKLVKALNAGFTIEQFFAAASHEQNIEKMSAQARLLANEMAAQ